MTTMGLIEILPRLIKVVTKVGGFAISRSICMIVGAGQKEPNDVTIEHYEQTLKQNLPKPVAERIKSSCYGGEIPNFNYDFRLQTLLKDRVFSTEFGIFLLKGSAAIVVPYMAYKFLSKCKDTLSEGDAKIASSFIYTEDGHDCVGLGGDQAD